MIGVSRVFVYTNVQDQLSEWLYTCDYVCVVDMRVQTCIYG